SLRGKLTKRDMSLRVHISNTLYLSSYNIIPINAQFYYDQINKFQPFAIEGYPSSLYTLALILRDAGLKLSIPIAFTSSETLHNFQRSVIEEQFGTEIFDWYGMTEGCIALDETANHNGYYEIPGYSINEYREDGVLCTSLINDAFPLIRYRVNDIIEIMDVKSEKNQQNIVKSIEGRKEDYILCKDGSQIKRLDFLFKGISNVRFSQLVQDENDLLHVNIVPETGFSEADKKHVERNLLDRVGNGNLDFVIELINESQIQYGNRGKFKFIIKLPHVDRGGTKRIV
ncbi:MAG TPA: phenylacetate--CoA ligase family protein, partial [Candidatus Parabacteroides intestinipullorum]|nr:phenylacetate--CoA ligase family protein [Candidatus Parabacteroides intestinipullorum]